MRLKFKWILLRTLRITCVLVNNEFIKPGRATKYTPGTKLVFNLVLHIQYAYQVCGGGGGGGAAKFGQMWKRS